MGYAKNRAMELEDRGFGEVDGAVCLDHMADAALAVRLTDNVTERECIVCGRRGPASATPFAVPFEALMEVIVETLHHFYADADSVLSWDSEDHCLVGPQVDTWESIDDIAGGAFDSEASDELMERIVEAVGNDVVWTPWNAPAEIDDLDYAWEQFADIAKYQTRLVVGFGAPADPPARLAHYLESVLVFASDGLKLVTTLPIASELYRGRLCEEPDAIRRTATDLGAAPRGKAGANRMSPAGVSFFYASGDPETAVAEIAGHGVESFAVVGKFTNSRELRVLDFTGEPARFSPFDRDHREDARMARFLKSFVHNITIPVIPDGRQHIEYAPTQLLTEFLRWVPEPKLDGIVLPSAQTGKKTYVLFIGSDECWTLGAPEAQPRRVFPRLDDEAVPQRTLLLDPEQVASYSVERIYRAHEAGAMHRAAAPSWEDKKP